LHSALGILWITPQFWVSGAFFEGGDFGGLGGEVKDARGRC
jgi:hypothetical protein